MAGATAGASSETTDADLDPLPRPVRRRPVHFLKRDGPLAYVSPRLALETSADLACVMSSCLGLLRPVTGERALVPTLRQGPNSSSLSIGSKPRPGLCSRPVTSAQRCTEQTVPCRVTSDGCLVASCETPRPLSDCSRTARHSRRSAPTLRVPQTDGIPAGLTGCSALTAPCLTSAGAGKNRKPRTPQIDGIELKSIVTSVT